MMYGCQLLFSLLTFFVVSERPGDRTTRDSELELRDRGCLEFPPPIGLARVGGHVRGAGGLRHGGRRAERRSERTHRQRNSLEFYG